VGLCVVTFGVVMLGEYISMINWIAYEYGKPPLFDVVHTYLPDMSAYSFVNWILVGLAAVRFWWLGQDRQLYLRLLCLALSLRALTISVTSQPSCACFDTTGTIFSGCSDFWYTLPPPAHSTSTRRSRNSVL
jgi:hypothetical protein